MQTFAQTIAPNAAFKSMSASCKRGRSTVVVRAHRVHDVANQVGKFAAVAAVTFALTMAPPAEAAAKKKLTSFQKELAYQQEMRDAVQSRSGSSLPTLQGSPTEFTVAATKDREFVIAEDTVRKVVKEDPPASVPKPE